MRQLTEQERAAMEATKDKIYLFINTEESIIAFDTGFKSGLEYQDKRIEALEAFIAGKITRDELEQVTK